MFIWKYLWNCWSISVLQHPNLNYMYNTCLFKCIKSFLIRTVTHIYNIWYTRNKTNHPISSNCHPSATANIAIHCLKRGGGGNIITELWYLGDEQFIIWFLHCFVYCFVVELAFLGFCLSKTLFLEQRTIFATYFWISCNFYFFFFFFWQKQISFFYAIDF